MDQSFMKTKNIFPLVLSMSLPMALSMLVNSLYNIVDSFFISQISEKAMTALSLIFPLQNTTIAVSVGLGIGVNAAVAFFLGSKDHEKADRAASLGLVLTLLHTLILMGVLLPINRWFLEQFTTDPETVQYGVRYGRIIFSTVIVGQIGIIYEKLFQAVGQMRISMIAMMTGCITNIILDPVMIFGIGFCPKMGIDGAAIATVIGQAVTLVIYYVCYAKGMLGVRANVLLGLRSTKLTGRIYQVGIPAMLSNLLPSLMITVMNAILAAFSATSVLILGIYYKLQTFIYLSANGIVQGIRPLVAYNFGAGEPRRVRAIARTALAMTCFVMAVGTILCLVCPAQLIGMFTTRAETVREGAAALRIISAGFIISGVSVTVCGVLEGLGFGARSFVINMLRYVLLILPLAFLLSRIFGAAGVWNAFWITETVAAVISFIVYKMTIRGMVK